MPCSAATVAEARHLAAAGADAIIAQGYEAGGHRGTFTNGPGAGLVGTLALVPQVVDAVSVPGFPLREMPAAELISKWLAEAREAMAVSR